MGDGRYTVGVPEFDRLNSVDTGIVALVDEFLQLFEVWLSACGVSLGHHFPSRLAGMGPASVSKNPKRGSKSCIARHMPFKKMPPII
jgi:hypothetical protein